MTDSVERENGVTLIRRKPLDSKGVCTDCSSKADHEAMQCFGCAEFYHVVNCPPGNTKGQVTRTFFNGWDNIVQNYKNIQYICKACLHDKHLQKDIIVSNRMCCMEEDMKGIKTTMDKQFEELKQTIAKNTLV